MAYTDKDFCLAHEPEDKLCPCWSHLGLGSRPQVECGLCHMSSSQGVLET